MTKRSFLIALPMLLTAMPVAATSGFGCEAVGRDDIRLDIVIGHAVAPMVAQVRLTDRADTLATADSEPRIAIAQSWLDEKELRLDLVDPEWTRFEAKVRLRPAGRSTMAGTLERNGKIYRMRCSGEE